jgi:hypothetical protein
MPLKSRNAFFARCDERKGRIRERVELSDGRVAVVQKVDGGFSLYLVDTDPMASPEYLVESGMLKECMDMLGEIVENDVCDLW